MDEFKEVQYMAFFFKYYSYSRQPTGLLGTPPIEGVARKDR